LLDAFLVGSLDNQVLNDVVRLVDMSQRATAQSVRIAVIFFFIDVAMRPVKQFERSAIAARVSKMRINRRMIIQVLAIVNRSMLDFSDGLVDLRNGMFFFTVHPVRGCEALEMSASMAQIGEGVQVSRMPSRIVCEGHRGAERNERCDYGAMS
jgi:hypothetical protein